MDITVNWKSLDFDNKGVFYTDANAYKIMKRDLNKEKVYPEQKELKQVIVSSYFYPVNSAIFIENPMNNQQMAVMNDRPQGGSAYKDGRIELMIIRSGNTQDDLGIWEAMKDWSADGKGPNVTAKFYLAFTQSREKLYRTI